jgi:hypothetical protein
MRTSSPTSAPNACSKLDEPTLLRLYAKLYAAAETPGRRGHQDSVYADIAEFAKQAHRDRHIGPS